MIERYINRLERHFGEIYIPHFAYVLVGLKILGLILLQGNPEIYTRLIFLPENVLRGEWWRLLGFLCIPSTQNLFWLFFELYLLVIFVQGLEQKWGPFKVNLYYFIAYALSVTFSLSTGWILPSPAYFERTLMLAFAALYPNFQLLIFFVLPVKLKWLAWLVWAWFAYLFIVSPWMMRFFLLIIFSNYFLFFGPSHWATLKMNISTYRRKKRFEDQYDD